MYINTYMYVTRKISHNWDGCHFKLHEHDAAYEGMCTVIYSHQSYRTSNLETRHSSPGSSSGNAPRRAPDKRKGVQMRRV
jgi:hypothetical protein